MSRASRAATFVAAAAAALASAPASGSPAPKLRKGPYLTGLSASGVEVRFELDAASSAAVDVAAYGSGDAAAPRPRTFEDRAPADMHVVRATGLTPSTRYRYVVRLQGAAVADGSFTTAPAPGSGAPLSFVVYGDDRSNHAAHAAVVRAIAAVPADFLVNTGDLVVDGGSADAWQTFFDIESPLLRDRALFVAIGNHELYDDRAGASFARYFGFPAEDAGAPRPYGTVRLGDARFFFLDAMDDWTSGEERVWLERALARADAEPGLVWRFAVMHQGPVSSGPHGGSVSLKAAHVPQMLAAHGIDLIFAGHDHIYERGVTPATGLKYVISGGGGAPLYRIARQASFARKDESAYHFVHVATTSHDVRLVARRVDGSILDQCGFAKGRPWDCDPPPSAEAPVSAPPAPSPPAARSGGVCSTVAAGGPAPVGGALVLLSIVAAAIVARASRPR